MGSYGDAWLQCTYCGKWGKCLEHPLPIGTPSLLDVDGSGVLCDPCYDRGYPPHSSVPPALELATSPAEPELAAPRELDPSLTAPRELDPALSSVRDTDTRWAATDTDTAPDRRYLAGLGRRTAAPGTPFRGPTFQQRGRSRSRSITPTLPLGRAIERVPTTAAELARIRQIEAADRIAGIRRVWD